MSYGEEQAFEEEVLKIAQVCHEANRALSKTQGDDRTLPWSLAPEWQRTSVVNGVKGVLDGDTPEESHKRWMEEKIATGWVRGNIKDELHRRHPCLVTYEKLPEGERIKDHLFHAVVHSICGPALKAYWDE